MLTGDIWNADCFGIASMTEGMNCTIAVPTFWASLGIYEEEFPRTTRVGFDRKFESLRILPTKAVGDLGEVNKQDPYETIDLKIPYIPKTTTITGYDYQDRRAFGRVELESLADIVASEQRKQRMEHDLTLEYHRWGALMGLVLDADGTNVVMDMEKTFCYGPQRAVWNKDEDCGLKQVIRGCKRAVRRHLQGKGAAIQRWHILMGENFANCLLCSEEYKCLFDRPREGGELRRGEVFETYDFYGARWEEAFAEIGACGDTWIHPDKAYMFPVGIPGMWKTYYGPGAKWTDVNSPSEKFYSHQWETEGGFGRKIHSHSRPLVVNRIPGAICEICLGDETVVPEAISPSQRTMEAPRRPEPRPLVGNNDVSVPASTLSNANAGTAQNAKTPEARSQPASSEVIKSDKPGANDA